MGIISLLCSALQLQSILGLALGTIVTEVLTTGPNIDACDAATIYHLLYLLLVETILVADPTHTILVENPRQFPLLKLLINFVNTICPTTQRSKAQRQDKRADSIFYLGELLLLKFLHRLPNPAYINPIKIL